MLKENEIRIGNIIQSIAGVWLIVLEINNSGITYDRFDMQAVCDHAEWKDLQGIGLTPEILEACGFAYCGNWELDNKEKKAAHDPLLTLSHYGGLIPQTVWINSGSPREIHLKYLHQLQNLYYALTGSELQVNLKENV